jgi:hypothetical protein
MTKREFLHFFPWMPARIIDRFENTLCEESIESVSRVYSSLSSSFQSTGMAPKHPSIRQPMPTSISAQSLLGSQLPSLLPSKQKEESELPHSMKRPAAYTRGPVTSLGDSLTCFTRMDHLIKKGQSSTPILTRGWVIFTFEVFA